MVNEPFVIVSDVSLDLKRDLSYVFAKLEIKHFEHRCGRVLHVRCIPFHYYVAFFVSYPTKFINKTSFKCRHMLQYVVKNIVCSYVQRYATCELHVIINV